MFSVEVVSKQVRDIFKEIEYNSYRCPSEALDFARELRDLAQQLIREVVALEDLAVELEEQLDLYREEFGDDQID